MTPTLLRGAFSPFGNIIDLSMDPPRNCAFVTYEKMESADQAVAELNGTQVESVQLKVNIARKQPMLDAATGKSVWGSLGCSRTPWICRYVSAQGTGRSQKDTRTPVPGPLGEVGRSHL